ncbi:MAG: epoxyqueuosine reductase QueH [Planctomycetota bacterium]
MPNLLLHICCGVCATGLIRKLKQDGYNITGYFYNPNIHPYIEFKKRLRAVEVLAEQEKLPVHYESSYGLDEFLQAVTPYGRLYDPQGENNRCMKCYEIRLQKTARKAKELGFDTFTSTLIISPQQNQAVIKNIGENITQSQGIVFKYEALTDLYAECKESAKKRQLYRQQYCGCIFSEYERYNTKPPIEKSE